FGWMPSAVLAPPVAVQMPLSTALSICVATSKKPLLLFVTAPVRIEEFRVFLAPFDALVVWLTVVAHESVDVERGVMVICVILAFAFAAMIAALIVSRSALTCAADR